MEQIAHMRLNISYYYSNQLRGISNTHYVDVVRSQNLAISVLKGKVNPLPSTDDQLSATLDSIKKNNPILAERISKRIAEQAQKGLPFNLGEILSNPLIK
jgi:hypothetical protein